jgi:predicted glycosyltransferase involved in capsule biosynthesis
MFDLKNVTFLIPVRVDQPERLRNLNILIRYLRKYFDTNILVGEAGEKPFNNGEIRTNNLDGYTFIKEDSDYFNRMKVVNVLADLAKTKIIVIQDTDVLLYPEQYMDATKKILEEGYGLVYPYNGNFYNVPDPYIWTISDSLAVTSVDPASCNNMRPEGDSIGGILFWDKAKFLEIGGCNEKFISWGYDDNEIYDRAYKLGVKIGRCEKGLFHLNHKPGLNSLNGNHPYYKSNEEMWLKIKNMTREELIVYTTGGNWNV